MADRAPSTLLLTPFQVQELLADLPRLTEQEVADLGHKDSHCSICLTAYSALLAEEEMALVVDSPAHPVENLGVTRLSQPWQCGHILCRKDLSQWILRANNACPMCRHIFTRPGTSSPMESIADIDLLHVFGLAEGYRNSDPPRLHETESSAMFS